VLTSCLRRLEQRGLLERTIEPTVPVSVSYELSPLGAGFFDAFAGLRAWADQNSERTHPTFTGICLVNFGLNTAATSRDRRWRLTGASPSPEPAVTKVGSAPMKALDHQLAKALPGFVGALV